MKVSEIPDSIFGLARDWSVYGFVRMPEYANLFTNSAWPGLIFRRVANFRQAMLFGGVIVGDDQHEVLYASKAAGGVGDWKVGIGCASSSFEFNRSPFYVRSDKLGFFAGSAVAGSAKNTSGLVDDGYDILITPKYAMAVVSNISMLGYRSKATPTLGQFFNGVMDVTNNPAGSVSVDGGAGVLNLSLAPLTQYLVQWAELPFAQDGGDFVRKSIPALVSEYPSTIRAQMTKVLEQVASDPVANPSSTSTFVLTRVTTSERAAPIWGGVIRGVYVSKAGVQYQAYAFVKAEPSEDEMPSTYRELGEISGPFYDSARKTLLVPGDLVISGGFGTEDLPASLRVASNFVIDMTQLHKEFAPASEVPQLTGEKNYFDLIKTSVISMRPMSNESAAIAERPGRRRLIEPLGARSVEVDLQNLLNRAEAIVMDERIYAASTGTAFGDATGQATVVPMSAQSTGYVYTKTVAEGRGDTSGRHVGSLIYESDGVFVAPEDGMYEIFVHTNGTTLHNNVSSYGIPAQESPRQVFMAKGSSYTIERSVGGYEWFVNAYQEGSRWGIFGPNFTMMQLCVDKGAAYQYNVTSDKAPSHGLRGSNGVVCGMRQQVVDGPVGLAVVSIRMVSRG